MKNKKTGLRIVAVLALVLGIWGATQFVAWKTHFAPGLGWNVKGIYPPWFIFSWAAEGYGQAPRLFAGAASFGSTIAAVVLAVGLIWQNILANTSRAAKTLHGSARWAKKSDIEEAQLFRNTGVFVGGWIDPKGGFFYRLFHKRRFHYLRYKGNLHVLALAPTRSGKGVCLVVPTLVTWMAPSFRT